MQESGEMYLETILVLGKEKKRVRAIDIVERLNYSRPSVSRALSILRSEGCITVDRESSIFLTEKGTEIAEKIYERHNVLSEALRSIGVDAETARADACRIEHVISDTSFSSIKAHMQQMSAR